MSEAIADAAPAARSRSGGRAGKRAGGSAAFEQPPFRRLKRPFAPTSIVSEDQLESIHRASLRVLSEIGLDVLHDEARRIMKQAGADVRPGSERVRFDPDMVLETIRTAPAQYRVHARNPDHSIDFGGDNLVFAQVASAPNCSDLDNGRRPGNQRDFRNLVKLAQMHNVISATGGYPV
jgi:trimethylamine--corrinoid protein Co-methyltransferase